MTKEEAAEIVLGGYKEDCPWCDGHGRRETERGDFEYCPPCYGNGYLVRDEWFKAQKVLGNGSFIISGRLVSEAHRNYNLQLAKILRRRG